MSPELGGVLLITILYGPIAVWLTTGRSEGPGVRFHQPFNALSEPIGSSDLARDELVSPVASDGSWICGACSSLNRREANRCYACRTDKGFAAEQAPGELRDERRIRGHGRRHRPIVSRDRRRRAWLSPLPRYRLLGAGEPRKRRR